MTSGKRATDVRIKVAARPNEATDPGLGVRVGISWGPGFV